MTDSFPLQNHLVAGREVLACLPSAGLADAEKPPLLFVHGAFAGAWMWADTYMPWFAQAGYPCYALSLRGHGNSSDRERIDWLSIGEYVEDLQVVAEWLETPAVLVGHSMGGFVVQKYLERHPALAAALLCAVPPQGLAASQFHMLFQKPGLFLELNNVMNGRQVSLDAIRESLFSQPVSESTLSRFRAKMQVESQRAMWDMTVFHLPTLPFTARPPLFIAGAEHDVMVPPFMVLATAHTYGVEAHMFKGMGHAITHERDWRETAEPLLDWLEAQVSGQTQHPRAENMAAPSGAYVNALA
ncbi:MAG: alpha/beta fold hydrolase [Zoogloeaceae bacterium]|nr:alpha/beta fold hydrolase [Zoogloeaceae bacterium]